MAHERTNATLERSIINLWKSITIWSAIIICQTSRCQTRRTRRQSVVTDICAERFLKSIARYSIAPSYWRSNCSRICRRWTLSQTNEEKTEFPKALSSKKSFASIAPKVGGNNALSFAPVVDSQKLGRLLNSKLSRVWILVSHTSKMKAVQSWIYLWKGLKLLKVEPFAPGFVLIVNFTENCSDFSSQFSNVWGQKSRSCNA